MPLILPPNVIPPGGTADCRLEYVDANTVRLMPYGGNQIMIGGVRRTIPAAGVTRVTDGASWSSLVLLWGVTWDGSALVLGVTTNLGITIDAHGMPTMTAFPAYTVVGMTGQAGGTGQFQQSQTILGVVSYWNRKQKVAWTSPGLQQTNSGSPVHLSPNLLYGLMFAGDVMRLSMSGYMYLSIAGYTVQTVLNVGHPGGVVGITQGCNYYAPGANYTVPINVQGDYVATAAGWHTLQFNGWTNGGVASFYATSGIMIEG